MKISLAWICAYALTGLSAVQAQVVINEIHYDPSDRTRPTEFVELHNATASPVNVGGWQLDDGIDFVFPADTVLAAGGFFVVAKDAPAFQAEYGFAPGGVFTGSLSNSGERIRLRDADAALRDEVTYGVGFPWPTQAKGGGGSMELIHPGLANHLGASWRTSGTSTASATLLQAGDGQWRYRKGLSEASSPISNWRFPGFVEDETWLPNARAPIGFGDIDGTSAVDANTVLDDMNGSYRSIFLRRAFTIPTGQVPGAIALRVRCDDGCIVWLNGTEVARVRVGSAEPAFDGAGMTITNVSEPPLRWERDIILANTENLLVAGMNVIAIQVFNTTLESSDLFIDAELGPPSAPNGSPGFANSVYSQIAPPAIGQVVHTPSQPAANVPVTIAAKITDPEGVGTVTLAYQPVNPGSYIRKTDAAYAANWTDVPMRDDGTEGDAVAGDTIYTAVLPAALQTHRRLMRYRVSASDLAGAAVQVPYSDDEQPNFAYFVYNGVPAWNGAVQPGTGGARGQVRTYPSTLLDDLQTWHLIANGTDVSNSQYSSSFNGQRFLGSIIYEGKVYDHITFRNRGIGSTYVSGKNKWALAFNRARNIHVRDNWGQYYNEDWNSFPIDACASPWAAVHRGMAGVEEAYSYRMFELAGMASLRTHYMHWRVIDGAAESGPTQYDGDFWGLYMGLEPTEGNFLDERGLPDGNLYAIEGGGGDKKYQGSTQPTSNSDWNAFRSASMQTGQTEAWYRANIDLDSLYTFAAVNRFVGNIDVRGGDNFRFYHRPTDGRWVIIPYDLDMMSLPAHHWGTNVDGVTYAGVPDQIRAITRHPAIAREFRNKARELLDLLGSDPGINGGQAAQLIDEYAQIVHPSDSQITWAGADEALWSNHPRTNGGGGASGQTSHRNNFFRTPYSDSRGGLNGTQSTNWSRIFVDPESDGYGTFADSMQYLRNYVTNTWPGGTWFRSNGNPRGYGYKYLEWESLYGGLGVSPTTPDLSFPNTPTLTYNGPDDFPANALDFTSSGFSPSATGGTSFAAMQWRVGEIAAPGVPGYVEGEPRRYEIEPVWTSAELTSFSDSVRIPFGAIRPSHTYRARVRHKDANGNWSHWSAPIQFTAGLPDVETFQNSLVISEVMYHPSSATAAEFAAGFSDEDFEYLEVRNVSAGAVELTDVRFTKGVDFDFPSGFTLAPGAYTLVVKNPAAFQMRYGAGKPIAGSYGTDSLNNSGEQVKLSFGAGTTIREFTYSDLPPWPSAADGDGYSLVRRYPENTTLNDNLAVNWRASLPNGGTPGSDDRSSYAAWAAASGITDIAADDDKDGLSNLLEYAFASNPGAASPEAVPSAAVTPLVVDGVAGTYLTVTLKRLTAAEDIQSKVQFSKGLQQWDLSAVFVEETQMPNGISLEVWRSPEPLLPDEDLFGRVHVTLP